MYTSIKFNSSQTTIALIGAKGLKTILANRPSPPRSLFNGQAVVLPNSDGLDPAEKIDLEEVSQNLRNLIQQVSGNFVQRDEMIEASVCALVAGEHCFFLGPPGTAKTAVESQLVQGIGGRIWQILMNQDIVKDAMFGTIDPIAYQNGKWERVWSGIATCDLALIDEVWKGSGQVLNSLLKILENRKAYEGDTEIDVPLLSVVAMSNEIPDDSDRQAIYDRFLIRLTVGYIKDIAGFRQMLVADAGTVAIDQAANTDELKLMAAAAEFWALHPPSGLQDVMDSLWKDIGVNGRAVSDRRWRKTLKLACAYALLQGEEPDGIHAKVARWTLWQDPDEEKDIRKLVLSKIDPFGGEILDIEALFAELKDISQQIAPTDNLAKSDFSTKKGGRLVNKIKDALAKPGIDEHRARLEKIKYQAEELILSVITMVE